MRTPCVGVGLNFPLRPPSAAATGVTALCGFQVPTCCLEVVTPPTKASNWDLQLDIIAADKPVFPQTPLGRSPTGQGVGRG